MDRRSSRIVRRAPWALAGLLAASCTQLRIETAPAPAPIAAECGPEIRGSDAVTGPGVITFVGELHGTDEAPASFGRLVCRAAGRAAAAGVLVGLEISRTDQHGIDALLDEPDDAAAGRAVLALRHFADGGPDGRTSAAMAALLLQLRAWRRAGQPITVVAFDVGVEAFSASDQLRDAEMAAVLERAIAAHPGATVMVYVGSRHARVTVGVPGDRELAPIGFHLRAQHPELRALDFAASGGSFWACEGFDLESLDCRARRLAGRDRGAEPFVELWARRAGDPYDGVLYLGRVTASPPAVTQRGTAPG
jgi:hypothetical protein